MATDEDEHHNDLQIADTPCAQRRRNFFRKGYLEKVYP